MEIERIEQEEKEERKNRLTKRMFWVVLLLNFIFGGYIVYEIIAIILG